MVLGCAFMVSRGGCIVLVYLREVGVALSLSLSLSLAVWGVVGVWVG